MPERIQTKTGGYAGSVLAVIVLYKSRPSESGAFRTILTAISSLQQGQSSISVLLFDNTPGGCDPGFLPEFVQYESSQQNAGLAAAYNRALTVAQSQGCSWLLTLDQDTTLPDDFLANMMALAHRWQDDPSIAAIVPQLTDGTQVLSPNYIHILRNTAAPRGYTGLNKAEIFALNSASLLRVAAIADLGGFCEDFWLDQLDLWLHYRLHRAGKRVFVAGNIQVEHKLSLLDYKSLSPIRFRNFLDAESAFYDSYKGPLENLALTATLLVRYCKHKILRSNSVITEEIYESIKRRVFHSRSGRIADWKLAVGKRRIIP